MAGQNKVVPPSPPLTVDQGVGKGPCFVSIPTASTLRSAGYVGELKGTMNAVSQEHMQRLKLNNIADMKHIWTQAIMQ